ncbi:uncharacterized protein LOC125167499 [Prionailurus viverrinus]|uniref:uncharacterized protein LOC125167499 n=1 Tax=Prionailurus viverrinus TaxID=61388 RepID=UPI001FF3FAD2|nr:uncharacterized protein LOC125167499 [Prionailurus viverrinus]
MPFKGPDGSGASGGPRPHAAAILLFFPVPPGRARGTSLRKPRCRPTSGQAGSSRPRPADARLPPGGRPLWAPPGPAAIASLAGRTYARATSPERSRARVGGAAGGARACAATLRLGSTGVTCILARSLSRKRCTVAWRGLGTRCSLYLRALKQEPPPRCSDVCVPDPVCPRGGGPGSRVPGGPLPSPRPSRFLSIACVKIEAVHVVHLGVICKQPLRWEVVHLLRKTLKVKIHQPSLLLFPRWRKTVQRDSPSASVSVQPPPGSHSSANTQDSVMETNSDSGVRLSKFTFLLCRWAA